MPRLLELFTAGSILSATSDRSLRLLIAKPNKEDLARVTQLVAGGELQAPIDEIYPLEQTADALRRLGPSRQQGKLVISV